MHIVLFYHSLISDWNHGNAHFLRGVVTALQQRGHMVQVYEPHNAWSVANLIEHEGAAALAEFAQLFPHLQSIRYQLNALDLDQVLAEADLVIVHEWSETALLQRLGEHRRRNPHYRLLFHDTHHRSISDQETIGSYQLELYDGVLAFGQVIADRYRHEGWADQVWTWHEAADTTLFYPRAQQPVVGDLVWIGNWGDDERAVRLEEFLFAPVQALGLRARIYGVRYPQHALDRLRAATIDYQGWLPNYRVPQIFGQFRVTVHVPRRPYVEILPGVPTIRVFEALACGIPLICSPWSDVEGLFTPGSDYLIAQNGDEMKQHLHTVLHDEAYAAELTTHGLATIRNRHTCEHRVDELLSICRNALSLGGDAAAEHIGSNAGSHLAQNIAMKANNV